VPAGRRLLRLPARAAFGTGSHESTSLALELLEDADLQGRRVLDVGTGTGVLAFAALAFGAASVTGFDVDPASPFHARDNSALNGLHPRLFAGRLAALREKPLFDLALVQRRPRADPARDCRLSPHFSVLAPRRSSPGSSPSAGGRCSIACGP